MRTKQPLFSIIGTRSILIGLLALFLLFFPYLINKTPQLGEPSATGALEISSNSRPLNPNQSELPASIKLTSHSSRTSPKANREKSAKRHHERDQTDAQKSTSSDIQFALRYGTPIDHWTAYETANEIGQTRLYRAEVPKKYPLTRVNRFRKKGTAANTNAAFPITRAMVADHVLVGGP